MIQKFSFNKYSKRGVVLVSDHEIGQVLWSSCTLKKGGGACINTAFEVGKPAINGSSLVTFECDANVCGVSPEDAVERLNAIAEAARLALSNETTIPAPVEQVEDWVGSDNSGVI